MNNRAMLFIDGTWLWHSMMSFKSNTGTKLNLEHLPIQICEKVADIYQQDLSYSGTVLCASMPVNTSPKDKEAVEKRRVFFEILKDKCKYIVETFDIDFKGRRLLKQHRHPNDTWSPKEKCVDIATAANMFYHMQDYDIAILVIGDKDFYPILSKLLAFNKKYVLASFKNSCSQYLQKLVPHIIWLDDLFPKIQN